MMDFREQPIIRKSFGLKEEIRPQLQASYHSPLIDRIKQEGYRLEAGDLTILLAHEFGFCYGVDRAVDYAYETRAKFPAKRVFLTNEIIHNPRVNTKLLEIGIRFLHGPYKTEEDIGSVAEEDIVIIPAFGNTVEELNELQKKGCVLVDATCGSVMSVWKRVESYAREGFTSVIHGKYDHEETRATSSRATQYPGGKYLVVRDKVETQWVCDYIERGGNPKEFIKKFEGSGDLAGRPYSLGFDPDRDLEHIGCANQTTMLSSESLEIAGMLQEALARRWGREELSQRFRHFDTICSATQDRQDAVLKLAREGIDVMIVVGGYNSSNTGHLVEISLEFCPAYHVKDASCILSRNEIEHKPVQTNELVRTEGWLPHRKVRMGVTAGASTPNRVIEEVIERVIQVHRQEA